MHKLQVLRIVLILGFYVLSNARSIQAQTNLTDSLKVKGHYDKVSRYLDINTDTARLFANEGIMAARKANYIRGVAEGNFYIAVSHEIDNKYDSSITYYLKSEQLYKSIGAAKSCAITLNNLGEMYFKKGNIDEAFKSYNEALVFFESIGHKEGIARTNFSIGIIFKVNGNYQAATDYFFRALSISESIKDKIRISLTLKEIGNIYLRQKSYDKAVQYYSNALKVIESSSRQQDNIVASIKCSIGIAYYECDSFKLASDNYNEAYTIFKNIINEEGMANMLENLGELNNKQGKYKEALAFNTQSLNISKHLNNPYLLASILYNRGSIFRGMGQYQQSLPIFLDAIKRAKILKDKKLLSNISEEISQTYEAVGNFKKAHSFYKLHKALSDSLNNDEITRKITTLELQYNFDKKQKALEFAQNQEKMVYEAKIKRQGIIVKASVVSSILLILLLFTGFGYYRSRQLAKLRALEIDLNKNIQQALSQQMNPHFVFNCLNSIKGLILDNKIEETEKYFNVFASLMRKNLEYSQHPAIPIKDEVEALNLYVELEKLRFKNKFKFESDIDEEIDQYACKIPSLLLQPFIENAILHGVRNKEGQGAISLEMKLDDHEIRCAIDDDGVGRGQAGHEKVRNHKSYGTSLTQKRLELICKLYGNAQGLAIIDKKGPNGEPIGTRVEFGIPIID